MILKASIFRTQEGFDMLARALIHAVSSGHTECVAAIMTAPAWQATGMQETRRRAEITLLHGAENVATIDEILKHSTDVSAADRTRDPESSYTALCLARDKCR